MTPGNHENIDNSLFFNNRFIMPGTVNPYDNNMYSFIINGVYFVTFNFDVIINFEKEKYYEYLNKLN